MHPAPCPSSPAGREQGCWPQSSPGRRLAVLPHPSHQEIGPRGPELPLLLPLWAKPGPWALQREKLEDSLAIINPGMARAEPSWPMTPRPAGTGHTLEFPEFSLSLWHPPPSWTWMGHPTPILTGALKFSPQDEAPGACIPMPGLHLDSCSPIFHPVHPFVPPSQLTTTSFPRNAERGVHGPRKTRNVKKSTWISNFQSLPLTGGCVTPLPPSLLMDSRA